MDERRLISEGRWTPPAQRKAAMIAAATAAAQPVLTVGQYVERIIQRRSTRARKPIVPTTSDTYRKDWRLRGGHLDSLPLTELTPTAVAAWWEDGLSEDCLTSHGRCYDLLKSVMTEAVEEELIDRNPCRVRGAGKPASRRTGQALTAQEVLAYLDAVPARYRVALAVAAWCGLRSGEVRGLRRCDIDLQEQVIWVRQGVTRVRKDDHSFEWRIARPKTEAGYRRVAMPSLLVEPLRTWLATAPMTGASGFLFPATDGGVPRPSRAR
ncbi:tyrosine-type recombinase/integrase [Arsenicicoccus piscis]|uniref:site-specific integrase n=1 Tax=Arsenicicoccus piscis TaxID=673954 RepID=UPI001F4CACF1|nr:tyrosine-type recombinase/integrase [Arsenicicoccus piscis]MCH8629263.1 tyrosine-type recombinase/integrase [Arsenicicoccus piscis]